MSKHTPDEEPELVELIRSVDVRAPQQLHEQVRAMVDARSRRPRAGFRPTWRVGAAATALAVVAVALVLVLGGGGSGSGGGLSLDQASALTQRAPTMPPPAESASDRAQLTLAVDGIPFPYWSERFGWRPVGARVDRVAGRTITTVLYQDGRGRQVGYSIVAGTPAPDLAAGESRWRRGTVFHLNSVGGANVITWTRAGHLCVMSGRGVDGATLLALASWHDRATAS